MPEFEPLRKLRRRLPAAISGLTLRDIILDQKLSVAQLEREIKARKRFINEYDPTTHELPLVTALTKRQNPTVIELLIKNDANPFKAVIAGKNDDCFCYAATNLLDIDIWLALLNHQNAKDAATKKYDNGKTLLHMLPQNTTNNESDRAAIVQRLVIFYGANMDKLDDAGNLAIAKNDPARAAVNSARSDSDPRCGYYFVVAIMLSLSLRMAYEVVKAFTEYLAENSTNTTASHPSP